MGVSFTIRLADLQIQIKSIHNRIYFQCQDYRINPDREPDLCIEMQQEDIEAERKVADSTGYTDGYLETLAVCRKLACVLPEVGVVMLQGCLIGMTDDPNDNSGYLFLGRSGAGPDVHSSLWLAHLPTTYLAGDDKILLRIGTEGTFAYGSPWQKKEGRNVRLHLKGICCLERSTQNFLKQVNFNQSLPFLMQHLPAPKDREGLSKVLEVFSQIDCPVYKMRCNNLLDDAFATSYAMTNGQAKY